ncbi:hypothetical protein OKW11_000347 [Pseudomonas baetica]|nr:hypothetical protein [Pseudomonas baetica]
MQPSVKALLALTCMTLSGVSLGAQTLTIATVNNSDMIRMQKLSKTFEGPSTRTSSSIGWCSRKTSCASA